MTGCPTLDGLAEEDSVVVVETAGTLAAESLRDGAPKRSGTSSELEIALPLATDGAPAFASLVFYGLYKDMFRRGIRQQITHALLFDEAHRAARLRLIPSMAKECRKYGISLVLASQEAKDFNISLFSAIANYLVLRLNEADASST